MSKYDEKVTEFLRVNYPSKTVAELATVLNIGEKSIIAKLSSMKIYVKPGPQNKAASVENKVENSKEYYVNTIAVLLGLKSVDLASLDRVNNTHLVNLQNAIIKCAHFSDGKK